MSDNILPIGSLSLDDDIDDKSSRFSQISLNSDSEVGDLVLHKTTALSLNDADADPDPDILMDESDTSSPINHFARHSKFKHEYTPIRPSPLKASYPRSTILNTEEIDDDEQLPDASEDLDLLSENHDDETSFTKKFSKTTSLIMSPTILGARVATHASSSPSSPSIPRTNLNKRLLESSNDVNSSELQDDDESDNSGYDSSSSSISILKNRNKPKTSSNLSKSVTSHSDEFDSTDDYTESGIDTTNDTYSTDQSSQTPTINTPSWSNTPIQLQMHHHHYYPSTPNYNDTICDDSTLLPAPWSKNAEPKAPAPYLISSYLQLLFNAITSSIAIHILISAIKTVKSDINLKLEERATEIAIEISRCTRAYIENRCAPETRVSALEFECIEWERCMNRDPTLQSGKASVSAETLGAIINSLIEPIGAKAIVVFGLGFIAWAFTSNFIFGFVRAKSYYGWNNENNDNYQNSNGAQQLQYKSSQYNNTPLQPLPPLPGMTPSRFTPGPNDWNHQCTSTPSR